MSGPGRRMLSFLTVRGRCVAAGGLTLLLVGAGLGERSLVQLAVFVLALPVLSSLLVARERFRLTARRTVDPARVPRGGTAAVTVEIGNADARTGGLWLLTEQLPGVLGHSPQFVVDALPGGESTAIGYGVRGLQRGRHVLGPLRLRLVDPFGLVERTTVGTDTALLVVVPRVRPLGRAGLSTGHGGGGEGTRRSISVHGEDDVSTREYRHGDDLRKVHWRATARTGELMVRMEERPWRAQATLLLDTRARAHLFTGREPGRPVPGPAGDDCPPQDSLEWLIEAAASIGTSLTSRGAELRTVTDTAELTPTSGRGRLGPEDLLDRLASVGPSRAPDLATGVDLLCRAAGDGPVVCLLGAVGPDDVVELARVRSGPTTDLAILADVGSWADEGGRARRSLSAASRATLDRQRDDAADLLRAAGWRVAVARAHQSVAEVWTAANGAGAAPTGASVPLESLGVAT